MSDDQRTQPPTYPTELAQELAQALDGTCLHEWDLNLAAARGAIIATHPNGERFAVQLTAWRIP